MKKSKFKLTHLHSATLDAGYLVPFLLQPTLPNDSFRIGLSTFLRAQPMLAPLMHEVFLNTQYWFCPYRILWDDWEDFITGGSDLKASPVFPTVTSTAEDAKVGSLWDYFGFPLETGVEVSALPFRALAEIWNTRYRDEDLQTEVPISYASGKDNTTNRKLLSPCISKDYFSVARPFTQRGLDIFVPVTAGDSSTQVYHEHTIKASYCIFLDIAKYVDTVFTGASITTYTRISTGALQATGVITYADDKTRFLDLVNQSFYKSNRNFLNARIAEQVTLLTPLDIQNCFDKTAPGRKNVFVFSPTIKPTTIIAGVSQDELLMSASINSAGVIQSACSIKGFKSIVFTDLLTDTTVTSPVTNSAPVVSFDSPPWGNNDIVYGSINGVYDTTYTWGVTLNSSGAISVRDLREASALQRYAERSLKYGNRYEEFIQRQFGISPRDSRIQRPEYLGGGRGLLNISEVLQTAESTDTGVGTMRGHGVGAITQRRIKFRSPEHGIIIGLLSIRPKIVYTQGIDREFLKRSRLDFFTPELANIGMQEVLTQEIYANSSNQDSVFGYSDRYQEYRYHKPLVTGEFRGNLNFWNMALEFANQPELNGEFVNMATYAENWKRPFQIQDNSAHAFICMLKNHIRAYRPVPKRAKDILK